MSAGTVIRRVEGDPHNLRFVDFGDVIAWVIDSDGQVFHELEDLVTLRRMSWQRAAEEGDEALLSLLETEELFEEPAPWYFDVGHELVLPERARSDHR